MRTPVTPIAHIRNVTWNCVPDEEEKHVRVSTSLEFVCICDIFCWMYKKRNNNKNKNNNNNKHSNNNKNNKNTKKNNEEG